MLATPERTLTPGMALAPFQQNPLIWKTQTMSPCMILRTKEVSEVTF